MSPGAVRPPPVTPLAIATGTAPLWLWVRHGSVTFSAQSVAVVALKNVIACCCVLIALFAVLLISVVVPDGVARAAVDYTTTHVVARRLYTTRRIDRCNRQRAPSAPQYRRPDRAVTSWCFRLIRETGRFGTYWDKGRWRALAEDGLNRWLSCSSLPNCRTTAF